MLYVEQSPVPATLQDQKQIPYGNDRQKSKGNSRSFDSLRSVRMTAFMENWAWASQIPAYQA